MEASDWSHPALQVRWRQIALRLPDATVAATAASALGRAGFEVVTCADEAALAAAVAADCAVVVVAAELAATELAPALTAAVLAPAVVLVGPPELPWPPAHLPGALHCPAPLCPQVLVQTVELAVVRSPVALGNRPLRALPLAAFQGVAITEDGVFIDVNRPLARMLGYRPDELVGRPVTCLVEPADQPAVLRAHANFEEVTVELPLIRRDGSRLAAEVQAASIRYGQRMLRYVVVRDVADRQRSQRNAGFLAELGQRLLAVSDAEEAITTVLQGVVAALGVGRCLLVELAGEDGAVVVRHDCGTGLPSAAGTYALADYPPELRALLAAGQPVCLTDTAHDPLTAAYYERGFAPLQLASLLAEPRLAGGAVSAALIAGDSRPRVWHDDERQLLRGAADRLWLALENARLVQSLAAETLALRESEARFRIMADSSPLMIWVHDADGRLRFVNRAYLDFFPVTQEQLDQEGWQPLVHPDDRAGYAAAFREALETRQPMRAQARVFVGPQRQLRWIESYSAPRFAADGRYMGMVGSSPDITEIKEAEQALRDLNDVLEQRVAERTEALERQAGVLSTVVDAVAEGVVMVAADGRIRVYNPAAERLLGARPDHLTGPWPGDGGSFTAEVLARALTGEVVPGEERVVHLSAAQRDVWLHCSGHPVREAGGQVSGAVAVVQDTTRRHQTEHAQRLEALGLLAGGVAHEINNVLQLITYSSHDLVEELAEADGGLEQARQDAADIRDTAVRGSSFLQQLLAFSRRRETSLGPVDLAEVIRGCDRLLRRAAGSEVRVVFDLAPNLPLVLADEAQWQQVLLNLVSNAHDAMPEGGELRISVAVGEDTPPAQWVRLTVADTGCGIAPEVRDRLFEPFFTTKPLDQGTGLGLASVYGIVRASSGRIDVISAPGHGATFTIELPVYVRGAI